MIFIRCLLLGGLVIATGTVAAKGEDLVNCLYNNGKSMDMRVCEILRKAEARNRAAEERRMIQQKADDERRAQLKIERDAKEAERKRVEEENYQVRRAEQDRNRVEAEKAQQEQRDWEAAQERAAASRLVKLKASCGEDFNNIRIGMSISRAQECVAKFKLTGQLNRTDGVVSTYQSKNMYAHVIGGKIVAWGK